ncbi:Spo0E family sporulation regulatory protein-aspartic acid phosphatase [Peribacillus asahii]
MAETTDLNSSETIYYSQELDQLITIYQKLSYTNMLLNGNNITRIFKII